MAQEKYMVLVRDLVAKGTDFTRDAMQLSHSDLSMYSELARAYGYKKPLLHSRGFGFYNLLRRVRNNMCNK